MLAAAILAAAAVLTVSAETGYVNTQSSGLNLRSGAGLTYPVLVSLPKGSEFEILAAYESWTRVTSASGVTGWVSSAYVGRYAQTYPAITLEVTSYKQYDSRWSDIKLGSGGTGRSIGCTATCAAMTESYRTPLER